MNPPKWAQELIKDTTKHLQSEGFRCDVPEVMWYGKPYRASTSGCCYSDYISIVAGSSKLDCKLVILHELAHWALPLDRDWVWPLYNKGHEGHTSEFWGTAWKLYRWAKLPEKYCLQREGNYRKGAEIAYYKTLNRRLP